MTINEIEQTLHTLQLRHKDLTEEMLVTLLSSSGWEEKFIKEAVVIFKTTRALPDGHVTAVNEYAKIVKNNSQEPVPVSNQTKDVGNDMVYYDGTGAEEKKVAVLPDSGKDIPVIKEKIDTSYVQPKGTNQEATPKQAQQTIVAPQANQPQSNNEPQSLVTPSPQVQVTRVEPPDDLPLKPFESSHHVWPLSKYKDVFHGELPPVLSRTEAQLVEEHKGEHKENPPEKIIKLKRTGLDGEDEGLIILTGLSLLVVLLLLAYMYSNGRL